MGTELAIRGGDPIALGEVLARSGFFQDSRDAAQAAVKVMAGAELGLGPVASMTGVNIIKGRVTLSANLIAGAVKRSAYDYRVTEHTDAGCTIVFYGPKIDGKGMEEIGTSKFDKADQSKAKLSGDNWTKFPRNMMFARAISNGAKWYCADVFGGPVYTPDEMGGDVDGETLEPLPATVVAHEPIVEPVPALEPGKWQPTEPQIVELRGLYGKSGWAEDEDHARLRMQLLAVGAGNQGDLAPLLAGLSEDQFAQVRESLTTAALGEQFDATEEKA